jgi:hypothetical protein
MADMKRARRRDLQGAEQLFRGCLDTLSSVDVCARI